MKEFDFTYGDEKISNREIFFIAPSMVLGVGILTLPSAVTEVVGFSDGWISILIAGIMTSFFAWITFKLAARFPNEPFYEYCSKIVTKPVAAVITLLFVLHLASFTSYEARAIATISKQYIFDRTPVEVISLMFVLLVAYAVSGSQAAILRLNLMFFPIVIVILMIVLIFNYPYFEFSHFKPLFQSDWKDLLFSVQESLFAFLGFEVLLFYTALVHKDELKKSGLYPVFGILIITLMYLVVFFVSIIVLSVEGTIEIVYPTVELAKEVDIPGGIIERIDPIFFTVWIMTIFNTSAMALDVSVMALQSVFKGLKKKTILFFGLPIIYFFSMLPQNHLQLGKVGTTIGYIGAVLAMLLPALLLVISKIRGVKGE